MKGMLGQQAGEAGTGKATLKTQNGKIVTVVVRREKREVLQQEIIAVS